MMYLANDKFIGRRSLDAYGEFCELELYLLRQIIKPGMTVVEAGANIGTHTVAFAKAVGATGRVLTFEPQRTVFHMLCGNLALNGLSNVQAINGGLAPRRRLCACRRSTMPVSTISEAHSYRSRATDMRCR